MNWKFWENGNKPKEKQTLCIIEEYLQKYDDKLHEMTEHIHNNEDLVQKSLRLQYKSNQEITKKLEQINEKIDKTEYYSKKHSDIQHDKDTPKNLPVKHRYGNRPHFFPGAKLICCTPH